jgi:Protein of unknown function (DUF664)
VASTAWWRAHMSELPEGWTVDDAVAFSWRESERADAVLEEVAPFDLRPGGFRPMTLRWAEFRLIEETARHVGHRGHGRRGQAQADHLLSLPRAILVPVEGDTVNMAPIVPQ